MKKSINGLLLAGLFCVTASLLFLACGGNRDEAIMESIGSKKKDMKEMAGITAAVDNGTVTLSGMYPDEGAKTICEQSINVIPGVKKLIDNGTVTPPPPPPADPVVIAADDPLTKSVNDAIKDYPGVSAAVKDGEVTLTGEIKRSNLQKLMMNLHTLKPKKINNQLTIK